MGDHSAIEWTDATWNPVTGCDRVSPGCAHCYALTLAGRLKAMGQPRYQLDGDPRTSGPGFGVTLHPDKLDEPLRWRKPRMVFVNSMSDLFHERIPDEFIERALVVMARATRHTFQILTKRPERALQLLADPGTRNFIVNRATSESTGAARARGWSGMVEDAMPSWPLPNVWLGVSIENARYTWRADVLREIPAAVRFISAEPLLGSLFPSLGAGSRSGDPSASRADSQAGLNGPSGSPTSRPERAPLDLTGIDWVIVGGESGKGARPMEIDWARELRAACSNTGTAFFFKQWGGPTPKSGGRLLDGRTWDEMPESVERAA